jgi:hypothetical protein
MPDIPRPIESYLILPDPEECCAEVDQWPSVMRSHRTHKVPLLVGRSDRRRLIVGNRYGSAPGKSRPSGMAVQLCAAVQVRQYRPDTSCGARAIFGGCAGSGFILMDTLKSGRLRCSRTRRQQRQGEMASAPLWAGPQEVWRSERFTKRCGHGCRTADCPGRFANPPLDTGAKARSCATTRTGRPSVVSLSLARIALAADMLACWRVARGSDTLTSQGLRP